MVLSPGMHNGMHMFTVLIAATLFIVALLTYFRQKRKRFLYVCIAFLVFAIKEGMVAAMSAGLISTDPHNYDHILNVIILLFFAFGLMKQ